MLSPIIRKTAYRDWLVDIFFLSISVLFFYCLWLGQYPLFTPDEGRYSEVAREMVASGDYITPRINGVPFLDKPVLYYWLQAFAIQLFGIKEWALRLFPALFGMMGCLLTYVCGRHLFDRSTGLLSALVLATTPLYFAGAHYANLDLEVAVLISASLLCFVTGILTSNHRRAFIFSAWVFVALAFLTKGLMALAFPALIGILWMLLANRLTAIKQLHLILGLFLFCLIVFPWYFLVQKANPDFLHYFFITQQVTRFLSKGEFNNKGPFWFYIPVILFGFFPWTIFLWQSLKESIINVWQDKKEHTIELFLLIWVIIIFLFFSIPHSKIMTYILPIFPALALLTGRYLSSKWVFATQRTIRIASLSLALFALMLMGLFLLLQNYLNLSHHFKPYLIIICCILGLSALISLALIKAQHLKGHIVLSLALSGAVLLMLTLGAVHLNHNSTKPLVKNLQTIIKPEDEVITYFKYYQDLPLYLGRQITVVSNWNADTIAKNDNWLRELWLGLRFQKKADWFINEEAFWQRFNGEKRVFVFLNTNYFEQFKKQANYYFYMGKHHETILLSNQPTFLSAEKRATFFKMRLMQNKRYSSKPSLN